MRRLSPILAALSFLTIIGIWAIRTVSILNIPGQPSTPGRWGMEDFREVAYYPVKAMLQGINPYDVDSMLEAYPVDPGIFLYSPSSLLLNLPFGILPYELSEIAYFAVNVALIPALAFLVLRCVGVAATVSRVLWLAAFIAAGRPVYSVLALGQGSLYMVLGTIVGLHYARSRPRLAGLGVAVTMAKATFGFPLILLMFVRRDFQALRTGVLLSILSIIAPTISLTVSAGGLAELIADTQDTINRESQMPYNALEETGWMRVNASIALVRVFGVPPHRNLELIVALIGLGIAAAALWALHGAQREVSDELLSSTIICAAILTAVHHYVYDAVLVMLPMVVLFASRHAPWKDQPDLFRYGLGALLAAFWFNFLATSNGLKAVGFAAGTTAWNVATSINSLILLTVFCALVWLTFHMRIAENSAELS